MLRSESKGEREGGKKREERRIKERRLGRKKGEGERG